MQILGTQLDDIEVELNSPKTCGARKNAIAINSTDIPPPSRISIPSVLRIF